MKTFEFTVKNLGPIKSANFSSAHLNVLCGKNNSGKSFLIHAVYCMFQYFKELIPITPYDNHMRSLIETGVCEFEAIEYLSDLNDKIEKVMPQLIKRLPGLMCKSRKAFEGCEISLRVNDDYVRSFIRSTPLSFAFHASKNLKISLVKTADSDKCILSVENSAETYPSQDVILNVVSFALRQLVAKILPDPLLLTAERSGVAAFASDVMSYALAKASERKEPAIGYATAVSLSDHYPLAMVHEVVLQNEIKQTASDKEFLMSQMAVAKDFYTWFGTAVMDGNVISKDGKLFYLQKSTNLEMPFNDASSSVKALTELNFFVHYMMAPGALLMIDEPELNLHPERQRMLARALARMAKTFGVGIVISTHSVTLVREFNTLLALGECDPEATGIARDYGYVADELLHESDFACGIVENGMINQQTQRVSKGFRVPSFDQTNEDIGLVQAAIVASW